MAFDVEKNPHGTRVSPFNFPSSSLCSSNPAFFFVQIWRLDRLIAHPAFNHPIGAPRFFVLRSSSSDPFFLCSLSLFFIILFFLFFFKSILQVPKSSLRDSVLLFRTRVYKTWDLFGIIFPTHQLGIESLTLKF